MTGLIPEKDKLLEIAVIVTDHDLNILAEGPNLVIHQPDEVKRLPRSEVILQSGERTRYFRLESSFVLNFVRPFLPLCDLVKHIVRNLGSKVQIRKSNKKAQRSANVAHK